ncbi:NAD(P)/FAD-dependent oxidoreductase [Kutzneria buriramensis]|uniref:2-polyprenyl-6-methoxyphenol hydroxylase-like FAD-dependent oxidoreductase n=1 Tax=Kutzneria buriramensis TaxID=1045776 RepID=A0A3E0I6Y4_9PSEU|nr:NAD(P)/FAD-dependent oxidoreductase [Kutzneria buriramensis]REH54296.1 2-polyprenyl-6-methoxyphenol hydroxylase-like FAD-dependent oxidoreductase [Kutzneria buriramensis]
MTRILIIGGGIAGTSTALAVHKAGVDVTVFEAHPDGAADIGAFLTLASNGMLALAQLDADEAVARVGFPLTSMRVTGHTGDVLAVTPIGDQDDPLRHYRCIGRAELGAALRAEAKRRGIEIVHGKRLTGVDDGTVTFADGSTATGDLIVGADGLNSTVRGLIAPTNPRYAGQRVFYGYTTDAKPDHEPGRIEMLRGSGTAIGYAVSPAGETNWFCRVPDAELTPEEIAAGTPEQWRDALLPLVSTDATPAAEIIAATGRLMVTNASDLPEGLPWRAGRMLLLGDAAHAASPATGQGASMAMEDAVVLGKAVRDLGVTAEALDAYEELRRPRVEQNIANSARMTAARTSGAARPAPAPEIDIAAQLDWRRPV